MADTTCPVLTPNLQEFKDFRKYLDSKLQGLSHHGIVKVIPPEGWFVGDYSKVDDILFKPVRQEALTSEAGAYTLHIEDMPEMSIGSFRDGYAQMNKSKGEDAGDKEKQFWRELGKSNGNEWGERMYGADIANNSLFGGSNACGWNLSNLDTILRLIGCNIPGVSGSMLYIGMWSSLFPFHVEDCDLFSINYLHMGDPKSWYCISPKERARFESLARSKFPRDFLACKEFLRHKTSVISPNMLKANGIPFLTAVQQPGEFIITFPGSYHAGYNQGFNIAEATNFANEDWIKIGKRAKTCKCNPDAVSINVELFETLYRRSQNFLGTEALGQRKMFRCVCDTNIVADSNSGKWVYPTGYNSNKYGKFFECHGCRVFCHVNCLYEDGYKPGAEERMLCEVCFDLENHPPERKSPRESAEAAATTEKSVPAPKSKVGRPPKQPRRDDDSDTDDSSQEDEEIDEGRKSGVALGKKAAAKKRKTGDDSSTSSPLAKPKSTIKKKVGLGDVVRARGVEGTVVSIKDQECRIHTSGTSRQEDIVVDISWESVALVKRASPGKAGAVPTDKPAVPVGRRRLTK